MRVVSLLPAATEIVGALGALETLVGVSHECDHPDAARSLPRVTGSAIPEGLPPGEIDDAVRRLAEGGAPLFTLRETEIARLRPDVLLTQALCDVCAVREDDVRALARRLDPPPAVVTLSGTTLDGVLDDVIRVAVAIGDADEGAELVAGLRARVRHVHETLKAARAPRPRVAVLEWTDPLFAAGHWTPELVRRAGGVDVLATAGEHSSSVELAAVRAADPEVLVFAPCGYDAARAAAEASAVLARPEWAWARERSAWALDAGGLTSRPGPRIVTGIEVLAQLLHPALFGAPDPAHARSVVVRS